MDDAIGTLATRHGLSPGAVRALADALRAGGGGTAQWSHPDLGGMGQWSRGGMLQIGAMFDDALKAKVQAVLVDLASEDFGAGAAPAPSPSPWSRPDDPAPRPRSQWWPDGLGEPSSSGSQNAMRYACFPDKRRLAIERDGTVTLYDTGPHRLTGFAQAQGGGGQPLAFSGPDGTVTLDRLSVVRPG